MTKTRKSFSVESEINLSLSSFAIQNANYNEQPRTKAIKNCLELVLVDLRCCTCGAVFDLRYLWRFSMRENVSSQGTGLAGSARR